MPKPINKEYYEEKKKKKEEEEKTKLAKIIEEKYPLDNGKES